MPQASSSRAWWRSSRLARGKSLGERRQLEEAARVRDADTASEVLARHLTLTAAGLSGCA
ncbi:hypothetical protein [Streptomyces sp. MUM 16J]|uniref:hypothetical protein n=1 Tax=Streptomyces sp. MUM 16J TaxID=2791988 RepID=UPI0023D8EC72|nr:hypothetical protein [Streptomyces sp. MUM 16J]